MKSDLDLVYTNAPQTAVQSSGVAHFVGHQGLMIHSANKL